MRQLAMEGFFLNNQMHEKNFPDTSFTDRLLIWFSELIISQFLEPDHGAFAPCATSCRRWKLRKTRVHK